MKKKSIIKKDYSKEPANDPEMIEFDKQFSDMAIRSMARRQNAIYRRLHKQCMEEMWEMQEADRIFSSQDNQDTEVEPSLAGTYKAQIHMYIWYSILTDPSFLSNYTSDEIIDLLEEKAGSNWNKLRDIMIKLKSNKDLIYKGSLTTKILRGIKGKGGLDAYSVELDNSNRFVYSPDISQKKISVSYSMFHYNNILSDRNINSYDDALDNYLQSILLFIYYELSFNLPSQVDKKFRQIIEKDYLSELFNNPDLI